MGSTFLKFFRSESFPLPQNEHRSIRNGARFFVFGKGCHVVGAAALWGMSSVGTRGAIGADAAHYVAGGVHHEAGGERRDGNGHIGQAEGAVTTLANEVQVQIRRIVGRRFAAMAVVGAEGVLHLSRAVLDMVHQMVLGEGGEGAKHRAALHRAQPRFAVGERKGAIRVEQRAQYQQPCGGGTNAAVQQFFFFVGGHGQVG